MTKYKIDVCNEPFCKPFGLFRGREIEGLVWRKPYHQWSLIQSFGTIDEARDYHETIKNLPEYL